MTTLSDGTTTVTLSDQLLWTDEFDWHPVATAVERSITGTLLVQSGMLSAGRPVTLASDGERGWIPRADIERLAALAALPGLLTLVLRGTSYPVAFRYHDGAMTATPVMPYPDTDPDDPYIVTLRFMTV